MSEPTAAASSGSARRAKVLPEGVRAHNRALVLTTLFHAGAMSRADLARETGLTRVTTSDLVGELVASGVVVEQGTRPGARPGKPAVLVDLDRASLKVVGIDLSDAHELRGAVIDLAGVVGERAAVPRPATGDGALDAVEGLAADLLGRAGGRVLGVGVGSPGIVTADGTVATAPNMGWSDRPVQRELRDRLGAPVYVANDADVAALAERTLGGAAGDFMLVKVGLGVGAGVVAAGDLVRGARGATGEIGHVTVGTDGGPRCACGRDGCLESWLSIRAMEERIAAGADPRAVRRDAGERLGIALAPVLGVLDLAEIILSGPAEHLDGPVLDTALDTLRERTFRHDDVRVRLSAQGEDVVLRGAVVLLLHGELGVT
ncbi:ROK family transcriptional regulator [Microbacterium halophytorum]|uniref:ROK family transcriptional regulator n=1 Tax=Microbacterium halophytorum TaxID=2067568 RepID=UPI000CFAE59D|nr:ROK family transcriptional regulator [Microbacterium halophytorum]